MSVYKQGKIYKLTSEETTDVYYGSTKISLKRRLQMHKANYKHKDHHRESSKLVKYSDCKIELVEEYPCETKLELLKREGWYQQNNDCVNHKIAGAEKGHGRTKEMRAEEYIRLKGEKIECECGVKVYKRNMEKHLVSPNHFRKPKPSDQPYTCECGMLLKKKRYLKPHLLTKQHLNKMK